MNHEIENIFKEQGGQFLLSSAAITERLGHIRAWLFDWDGVFNNGNKGEDITSLFSETDSMGLNLLRYTHYMQHGAVPFSGIITGENNHTAYAFARRERLNTVYFNFKNKKEALHHLQLHYKIQPREVAYVFDDVLDLSLAAVVGLRFYIKNPGTPVFSAYVKNNGYADYVTGNKGGSNAIREICELSMSLKELFEKAIENRMQFSDHYSAYLSKRNNAQPVYITSKDGSVVAVEEKNL